MLQPGSLAPDFETETHTGTRIRVSQLLQSSNVVLYFYPRDFTAGCTKEACLFNDQFSEIQSLGAVILGISGDTAESHRRFAGVYQLPYFLGSDPGGSIARSYDAMWLGFFRLRVTYVIEKGGVIRGAVHHEVLISSHVKSALLTLKTLSKL